MSSDRGSMESYAWATGPLRTRLEADARAVLADRGLNVPAEVPSSIVAQFAAVACRLWVDGDVMTFDQFHIDPADEGLLFGRGAWESTRTVHGKPWLWDMHLERLRRTLELLYIEMPSDRIPSEAVVQQFVETMTDQDLIIRVNVSAGRPGHSGRVWMTAAPIPLKPDSLRIRTCRNPVTNGQPYLALKTFEYATRLRIAGEAGRTGFDSALMISPEGNVQEVANANIFLRLDDGWATPAVDGGFLPGTVRRLVLQQSIVPVREKQIPVASLGSVVEAFATNSNVGIVPVTRIDDRELPIGSDTKLLIERMLPPERPGIQYRFRNRGGERR